MTLSNYVRRSLQSLRSEPPPEAMKMILGELYAGVMRRSVWKDRTGTSIWEKDWDILCICDACRVDLMESALSSHTWLPEKGDLQKIESVGTTSSEWIESTFEQEKAKLGNIVYISGNPYTHLSPRGNFNEIVEISSKDWESHEVSTVPPEVITDLAIDYLNQTHENTRIILHYMQPHTPFRSRPEWFGETNESVWHQLRRGKISRSEFWEAYRDNLFWALEEINRLRKYYDGKIAISSDHGNAVGEYGLWGHPERARIPPLVNVPWIEISGEGSGSAEVHHCFDDWVNRTVSEETEERLQAFGYLD